MPAFQQLIPVLRIFDLEKAKAFYVDYLGFGVDWEHRFEADAPVYLQVSRGALALHLSEHHGDGTPGSVVYVPMTGLDALHAELRGRGYRYLRPGVEATTWGTREMQVIDPFGNRIRFAEVA